MNETIGGLLMVAFAGGSAWVLIEATQHLEHQSALGRRLGGWLVVIYFASAAGCMAAMDATEKSVPHYTRPSPEPTVSHALVR